MMGTAHSGAAYDRLAGAIATLKQMFADAGHTPIDPPHLFPAETLLDLYGEDLRARAFLFPDPESGTEICLRPDFTVPIALAHGEAGWDTPAAYAYAGSVFRRQPAALERPVEYLQAGVERFLDSDPVAAEVTVFNLLHGGLTALGHTDLAITIGDLSIPFAILDALEMSDTHRAALRHHIWRPKRFQDLLRRACTPAEPTDQMSGLLALAAPGTADALLLEKIHLAGDAVGLRTAEEVVSRLRAMATAAREPAMPKVNAQLIERVFSVSGPATRAAQELRQITSGLGIDTALDRFESRLDALADHGADPAGLTFDADFGRNLEYYDGFVFEMALPGTQHPPLAGGGRYDAMTRRLGATGHVPAVGGIIRPQAALEAAS